MARIVNGYAIATDQGDPEHGRPVKYLQVRFPGIGKELRTDHMLECSDIHDCTLFNLGKPGHRAALAIADVLFPNAVPIQVRVTRSFDVILEIPDEYGTNNLDCKRTSIQLP